MRGIRDMPLVPLIQRAHVKKLEPLPRALDFLHGHLPDFIQRQSRVIPCLHSADEVAGELRITSAEEESNDFMSFSSDSNTKRMGLAGSSSQPAQMESMGEPPMLNAPLIWPPPKASIMRVSMRILLSSEIASWKNFGGSPRTGGRLPSTSGPLAFNFFKIGRA